MTKQSQLITREGFHKLSSDLTSLQKDRRPKAVDRLKKAREMGDLSENSEYVAAREELNMIDTKIFELEHMMKNATIKDKGNNTTTVEMGDLVSLDADGIKVRYQIVGEAETNIKEYKISHKSPIGTALIGKKKGDAVDIQTPKGISRYKILDIQ